MNEKSVSLEFFAGVCKLISRCYGNRLLTVEAVNTIKDYLADIEAICKSMEMVPKRKPGIKGKDAYWCSCWDRDAGVEPVGGADPKVRRGSFGGPLHERGSGKCWAGKRADGSVEAGRVEG